MRLRDQPPGSRGCFTPSGCRGFPRWAGGEDRVSAARSRSVHGEQISDVNGPSINRYIRVKPRPGRGEGSAGRQSWSAKPSAMHRGLSSLRKKPMPPPKIRPPNMTMTPTRRIRTNFTTMLPLKNRPPAGPFDKLRAADDRRPRGHPRTAPAPCRTKPAAGMSRVDPGQDQLPGPTRLRVSIIGGVSRQGTDAPECFRSAASGMRRTIAPLPVDHHTASRSRQQESQPPSRMPALCDLL